MPNHITSIVDAGVDAFSNLYEVKIYGPTFNTAGVITAKTESEIIAEARINDFTPPEETVEDYEIPYMMVKIKKLKPKLKIEKTLSIPIRVDKEYDTFNKLTAWKKYFANLEGEGSWKEAGPENDAVQNEAVFKGLGKIVVTAFKSDTSDSTGVAQWIFEDVICAEVGTPSYKREGSEVIVLQSKFIFTRMREVTIGGSFDKKVIPSLT